MLAMQSYRACLIVTGGHSSGIVLKLMVESSSSRPSAHVKTVSITVTGWWMIMIINACQLAGDASDGDHLAITKKEKW